jgi:hypothetical protein
MAAFYSLGNGGGGFTRQDSIVNNTPGQSTFTNNFVYGCWVKASSTTSEQIFTLSNAAPENLILTKSTNYTLAGTDSNGPQPYSIAQGTSVIGAWAFCLVRSLGSNLRYFDLIDGNGVITHGSDSTILTFLTTPTSLTIGNMSSQVTGAPDEMEISEFWWCDADILPTTAAISDSQLQQLAYRGPFSFQGAAANIAEYRAFRLSATNPGPPYETYTRPGITQQVYVFGAGNGCNPVGSGSPVPASYIRPGQTKTGIMSI